MPEPEPLTKAEPVALLDLVKLAIVVAGYFGLAVPEDTGLKVGAAIVALYAFAQATWFTRKAVTPEQRAKQREAVAYGVGAADAQSAVVAVGSCSPTATVTTTLDVPIPDDKLAVLTRQMRETAERLNIDVSDVDPVAEPAPPAPPPATPTARPLLVGLPIDWAADDVATRPVVRDQRQRA